MTTPGLRERRPAVAGSRINDVSGHFYLHFRYINFLMHTQLSFTPDPFPSTPPLIHQTLTQRLDLFHIGLPFTDQVPFTSDPHPQIRPLPRRIPTHPLLLF
ncbi:pr121.3 [rat cytomegalovirus strain Maastricht]|uniref:Pr121.3 n=1 Tax=Rat cytomegalovirus (strain Maastricht) TaxID=79700 RepID=Q9DW71_RCMVM|nr:pr121.3 [rat cytomegalovirus strain Maastricht]AAF99219.1 pr121.3 [rat cytomegalovirus strain Maastricht]